MNQKNKDNKKTEMTKKEFAEFLIERSKVINETSKHKIYKRINKYSMSHLKEHYNTIMDGKCSAGWSLYVLTGIIPPNM